MGGGRSSRRRRHGDKERDRFLRFDHEQNDPASPPAWISSLKDSALKTDFTSFYSAGSITEAEMAKALGDLAAELNAAKTTLSMSQVADLKSIAEQYRLDGRFAYLQFITNAFVNGNPANARWTGGAAKSVALGNLARGLHRDPAQRTDRQVVPGNRPAERLRSR